MNSKIKKALCVAVAGASLVGALSGCSNSKEVSNVVTYWAGIPMGDGSSDAETPVTEFVEMPIPNEVDNSRGQSCVSAVLHINQSFSIDLFDTASTTFIKNLLGAINHAQ